MTSNRQTIRVAGEIQQHGQRDRWDLAYAIMADAPASWLPKEVSRVINELCVEMAELGISKLDGSAYDPAYLTAQRRVAVAWAPHERQTEASFEAHAENREGDARETFLALCAAARGEDVAPPKSVKAHNWRAAKAKTKTAKKTRYKVQAQAVRTAKGKGAKNTPTRLDKGVTFSDLLKHLTGAAAGLRYFNDSLDKYELDDDDRDRLDKVLVAVAEQVTMTRERMAFRPTDEALADLLA